MGPSFGPFPVSSRFGRGPLGEGNLGQLGEGSIGES